MDGWWVGNNEWDGSFVFIESRYIHFWNGPYFDKCHYIGLVLKQPIILRVKSIWKYLFVIVFPKYERSFWTSWLMIRLIWFQISIAQKSSSVQKKYQWTSKREALEKLMMKMVHERASRFLARGYSLLKWFSIKLFKFFASNLG